MNVVVVLLMPVFGILSSSGTNASPRCNVDAGAGAELVIDTIRPGGDQAHLCRPFENLAEEPCA